MCFRSSSHSLYPRPLVCASRATPPHTHPVCLPTPSLPRQDAKRHERHQWLNSCHYPPFLPARRRLRRVYIREATPSAAGGEGSCRPSFLCSSRHASGAVSGAAGGLGAGSGWAPAPLASSSSSTGTRRSRSPAAERGRCAELRSTRIIIGGDVTCSAPPILGPVYVELRQDVLDAGCSCV